VIAKALMGAVVYAQRLATGTDIGQNLAQCLRAGDGHAWAKRAIEIEIHGLY
jgi:hypothetical protein